MMVSTFPRFLELPAELQTAIWQHAATECRCVPLQDILDLGHVLRWYNRRHQYAGEPIYRCFYRYRLNRFEGFPVVPDALFEMGRLAKIAALQQWKINIEGLRVLVQVPNAQTLVPVFKQEVTGSLDEDIAALQEDEAA